MNRISEEPIDFPKDRAIHVEPVDSTTIRTDILTGAFYNDRQQRYYLQLHRLNLFMVFLLGSSTMAAFAVDFRWYGQISGGMVAILTALNLVFDFSGTASRHAEIRSRFYELLGEHELRADPKRLRASMARQFSRQPPVNEKAMQRAASKARLALLGADGRY